MFCLYPSLPIIAFSASQLTKYRSKTKKVTTSPSLSYLVSNSHIILRNLELARNCQMKEQLCFIDLLSIGDTGVRGGSQARDISGWCTGGLNNSQVSDTQKNYGWLTYAGINPASLLMAKRCVFKCHKNSAVFPANSLL